MGSDSSAQATIALAKPCPGEVCGSASALLGRRSLLPDGLLERGAGGEPGQLRGRDHRFLPCTRVDSLAARALLWPELAEADKRDRFALLQRFRHSFQERLHSAGSIASGQRGPYGDAVNELLVAGHPFQVVHPEDPRVARARSYDAVRERRTSLGVALRRYRVSAIDWILKLERAAQIMNVAVRASRSTRRGVTNEHARKPSGSRIPALGLALPLNSLRMALGVRWLLRDVDFFQRGRSTQNCGWRAGTLASRTALPPSRTNEKSGDP